MDFEIKNGSSADVELIDAHIKEFEKRNDKERIEARLADRQSLILIAVQHGRPIGYKVGYALDEKVFHSWIGGVLPEFRGRGAAQLLLEAQEKHIRLIGYEYIQVKSMNRFPAMLRLLIRNGYEITGFDTQTTKISFQKTL
ncbi:GNAT family N-acetyltransferase [Sneathiella glossodoripedis]|uniref:GNAT family N-acetyltransferase n=1 Tax=Sneathiella glossodoripedis TaxID=418853 RepID=UPI00046E84C0|nr:GNAT family N-acetyltransferase [Sneathiella glossodoripedis]